MKKIYHITENISFESGGVRTILIFLNQYLKEKNICSNIITNKKEQLDDFLLFKSDCFWNYNNEIKGFLNNLETDSIFHLHGVYTYNQFIAYKIANTKKIPLVTSPHGMLEPWILNKNKIKKNIYLKLILNKILENSTIIHAITPLEKENLFKLTNHKNIIEIPNLINFKNIPTNLCYNPEEDYFVFIGRLDPKKGLDLIIEVFDKINLKNTKLYILGKENEYSNYLKKIINKYNLKDKIVFKGAVFGEEKYKIIANARALLAPSYSEAIGMVNLEAAACKTPVITTFQTGINKKWSENGGILINPNFDELKTSILRSLNWTDYQRYEFGNQLNDYTFQNYSWEKKGYLWYEIYNSL